MTRLRGVVDVRRDVIMPSEMDPVVDHFSIPSLDAAGRPETVARESIDSHKVRLVGGEVLVSRLNPRKSRVHLVPRTLQAPSVASTEFVPLMPRRIDPRYLRYLLLSEITRQVLDSRVRSATRSHQRVESSEILALAVPCEKTNEQRRIADFLDDRIARIDQVAAARQRQLAGIEQAFEARRRDAVLGRGATRVRGTELPWAPVIPEGWPVRRLSQLAALGTGHTPSRSRPELWVDCDVNWLTTSDVHRFRRDEIDTISSTETRISDLGLANSAAVLHPKGTVALSRTASAGFSILMDNDMATSQDFVTWTPGPALSAKYLLHALRVMRPFLLGFLATGSTHKTIYFPDLMDLRIPVPDRAEQDEAVRRVEAVAETRAGARAALEREVDLLREYKQSLITAAVTGQIDVTTASTRIPGVS